MKCIIKLIFITQILFLNPSQALIAFQYPSSITQKSAFKDKYSEYFKQGENSRLQGDYEKSIQYFRKALNLAQKNKDAENEVESLIQLGVLYWNIGQLDNSFDIYQEALSFAEKAGMFEKKAEILNYVQIYDL